VKRPIAALILLSGVVALNGEQAPTTSDLSGEWVIDWARSHVSNDIFKAVPSSNSVEGVVPPKKIKGVPPQYPAEARDSGSSGTVLLEGIIDTKGQVADLRVVKSIRVFDQAAMAAVWQWEYTPTLLHGKPVEVMMTVVVTFALGDFGFPPLESVPVPYLKGSFGTGLGEGRASEKLSIQQDPKKLTVLQAIAGKPQVVTYTPGAKAVTNTIPNYGSAKNNQYKYASHWDGDRLVTDITWSGPLGPRIVKETIALDAGSLTITTSRPDPVTGADAFVQTLVYGRQK
jgi:TonB family protein